MATPRDKGEGTRLRILEAASEIFSQMGFHDGTVALICDAAAANRAAVNYYFGGKDDLYREVWNHTYALALEAYPLEPAERGLSAEEQLRVYMRSLLLRAFDEGPAGHFSRIQAFEMPDPQEFLQEERQLVWEEHNRRLEAILREMLGEGVRQADLDLCRVMVQAPCFGAGIRHLRARIRPVLREMRPFDPEEMVERMFEFVMAGVRDLERRIEARETETSKEARE